MEVQEPDVDAYVCVFDDDCDEAGPASPIDDVVHVRETFVMRPEAEGPYDDMDVYVLDFHGGRFTHLWQADGGCDSAIGYDVVGRLEANEAAHTLTLIPEVGRYTLASATSISDKYSMSPGGPRTFKYEVDDGDENLVMMTLDGDARFVSDPEEDE